MSANLVSDINIIATRELPSPASMRKAIKRTPQQEEFVVSSRETIRRIIFGDDQRLLAVVGPCSIHDVKGGLEYAKRLVPLAKELSDRLCIVMRVYFEKPRTSIGWKGLIMDPNLDGTHDIPTGLTVARQILRDVLDLGLPTATELLDPITPQYIADLICWSAIGARTTESQTHRQMASGLSMPLGFKNGTDGSIDVAINAIKAAGQQQSFLGINADGHASAVTTKGNPNCHIVLRGGSHGPNYDAASVRNTAVSLQKAGLTPAVMVDCSHDNSNKNPERQPEVLREILQQIRDGDQSIIGVMLESNLLAGSQKLTGNKADLVYGQSITDGCIDFPTTEAVLREAHAALSCRFA